MNPLLHRDRDEDIADSKTYGAPYGKDREITLGTTMILGIFFALAVFAAVFFGFGYSMGAKHAAGTTTASVESGSSTSFNNFKPAPGNPLGGAPGTPIPIVDETPALAPVPVARTAESAPPYTPEPTVYTSPASQPTPHAEAGLNPSGPTLAIPSVKPIPRAALASNSPATTPVTPAPVTGTGSIVQVAAVSHQEDADLLVTTLKRRGYAVAVHTEPQDKLLHVQIGPFPNRADANTMRQRLLADGFNAIVK